MSVQRALRPGGLRRRFTLIFAFLFLIHNPSQFSVLEVLRMESVILSVRITLGIWALVILIVLARQTWTGVRTLGRTVVIALLLALGSLLWFLREWIELSAMTRYLAQLSVYAVILTFGQVTAFYVRQLTGQTMVLKNPP